MEGVNKVDQVGVVDMLEDNFFSPCVLELIFFNYIIFENGFHGVEFFGSFLFNEQNCSKSSFSQDYFRNEVIECNLFFKIPREECSSGFPDDFLFFFLALQIFLVRLVIMKDVFSLNVLGS